MMMLVVMMLKRQPILTMTNLFRSLCVFFLYVSAPFVDYALGNLCIMCARLVCNVIYYIWFFMLLMNGIDLFLSIFG